MGTPLILNDKVASKKMLDLGTDSLKIYTALKFMPNVLLFKSAL